ncbi:hypothetical protein SETIT_5G097400v2 [Setaria italica]|uniref:Uncharacterized protein n=1 Tax=Setaria italica TaxID=4555 RepID=A0A368R313_SETIT|nr:hypothetical protein SETIT_5G097400v2 [Setaria italica]
MSHRLPNQPGRPRLRDFRARKSVPGSPRIQISPRARQNRSPARLIYSAAPQPAHSPFLSIQNCPRARQAPRTAPNRRRRRDGAPLRLLLSSLYSAIAGQHCEAPPPTPRATTAGGGSSSTPTATVLPTEAVKICKSATCM